MRRCETRIALALLLSGAAPAAGVDLARVEALSVGYAGFLDDFEDGIFPDGGPDEPLRYFLPCGEIGDQDEAGGRLTLAGPDPTCGLTGLVGESVASFFAAAGDLTLGATYVEDVPAPNQGYGVTIAGSDGADFVNLSLARSAVPGVGNDALLVVLVDEDFAITQAPVAVYLVAANAASYVPDAVIELRLSILRSGEGFLPSGAYRTCPSFPCDAGIPFTELPEFAGGGELAAGEFHGVSLTVADVSGSPTPAPFSYEVEELRVEYGEVVDDFENDVFGDPYPYVQVDGGAGETGGALALQDGGFPGSALVALDASLPAAATPTARYRFALPAPCGSYGVSTGNTVGTDFAALELVRRPLPGVGDDVLHVVTRSEPEAPLQFLPVFERAVISEAPLDDAALDDVVAIELELALVEDPAAAPPPPFPNLLPHGRYRLCTSADCAGAGFQDLAPVSEPPPDPEAEICGLAAASFAPPPDAGRIDSGPPLGVSVLAVPEPGPGLACATALVAALGLARGAQARGRTRGPLATPRA
jgi:hypothetical protein